MESRAHVCTQKRKDGSCTWEEGRLLRKSDSGGSGWKARIEKPWRFFFWDNKEERSICWSLEKSEDGEEGHTSEFIPDGAFFLDKAAGEEISEGEKSINILKEDVVNKHQCFVYSLKHIASLSPVNSLKPYIRKVVKNDYGKFRPQTSRLRRIYVE